MMDITLRDELQQKCADWGVYWRASDAHGVELTHKQALELLRDALGVEVDFKPTNAERTNARSERVHALVNAGQFPGMSEAFDAHMGAACWVDHAYRQDAATWAAAWKSALAAQAGPALVPLTDEQARAIVNVLAFQFLLNVNDENRERMVRRVREAAIEGATSPESTRPADASISEQRVNMAGWKLVPMEPSAEFIKLVENSGVWRENEVRNLYADIIAAAPQAPAEQRTVSLAKLNDTTGHSNGGEMWGGYGSFWLTTTTDVMPAEPAAQAVDDLLPERLMRFFLRDLKAQLKALGGFVALGNELGRAREYEDWIAAVERYCARYPDHAAREAGTGSDAA